MGFTFGCGFLIVCFMQRMRLKSRDAVVVLVTLKVPEHLWTGLDIELFLENSALCVPCRKLWCLWKMPPLEGWGCEPTLGLSYRCYPLCFFFLFDKRTGLKWYTCLVVIGFLCLDTFKRKKKRSFASHFFQLQFPELLWLSVTFSYSVFVFRGPDIIKMIWFEHTV